MRFIIITLFIGAAGWVVLWIYSKEIRGLLLFTDRQLQSLYSSIKFQLQQKKLKERERARVEDWYIYHGGDRQKVLEECKIPAHQDTWNKLLNEIEEQR